MRRILLIVLVALLPLQWSGAVAAGRCLHGDAQRVHDAHADAVSVHVHGHDHARSVHRHHPGQVGGVVDGDAPSSGGDVASVDASPPASLGDCDHGDCGGCCHGTVTAPPAAQALPSPPAFGAVPSARVDASPVSPALDGPFRPPRTASA